MRSALARAAIRRGSSMMIFLPFSQGASSSASGTRVVLPAPGGATSTAALLAVSVRPSSSSTASIGRGVSKVRGKYHSRRHARRLCRASTSLLEWYEDKTWMAGTSPAMTEITNGAKHHTCGSAARPTLSYVKPWAAMSSGR